MIRPMQEADLKRVAEIDAQSFTLPWPENSFRYDLLRNRNSHMWVAEVWNGQQAIVAASLVVWVIFDEAHIGTIAVAPEFRGMKIATRMLEMLMDFLKEQAVEHVFLEVRKSNLVAQRLYQRFGFQAVRIRPRYYSDNNEDAIEMEAAVQPKMDA